MSKAKSKKTGKPTFSAEEATKFVKVFCASKTYQEAANVLGMDVNLVMYNAQVLRSKGVELPYLKFERPPTGVEIENC